jgi:membrane-associated phospholipid phosphatase
VEARACESDFGFVSGHAFGSIVTWLLLGRYLDRKIKSWAVSHHCERWRRLIVTQIGWLGVAFVLVNIGIARMYLGVHFPHQVCTVQLHWRTKHMESFTVW